MLSRSARTSLLALALVTVWVSVGIASSFAQQPARCEVDKARFTIGQPYSPNWLSGLAVRPARAQPEN